MFVKDTFAEATSVDYRARSVSLSHGGEGKKVPSVVADEKKTSATGGEERRTQASAEEELVR